MRLVLAFWILNFLSVILQKYNYKQTKRYCCLGCSDFDLSSREVVA